jgi:hypothetical protein
MVGLDAQAFGGAALIGFILGIYGLDIWRKRTPSVGSRGGWTKWTEAESGAPIFCIAGFATFAISGLLAIVTLLR